MSNGMTPQEAHELFSGYADGELNEEQSLRALEQMAADPANTKRVLHQQQLKQACGRIMDSQDMRCPDALRDKICSIANEHTQEQPAPTSASVQEHDSPVIGRIGQWLAPIAVAATLFIGALVALSVMNSNRGYHSDGILTASLAQTFGERHVKCSIGQSAPYDGQLFPAEIGQLDDSLVQHVGQELDGAALDLSTLGYEYKLAGFCPLPGDKSVHVMYENDKGQMLSLWIKAYDGKPTLDPGVPYIPPTDHTEQPMMVWREGDMVFYLVGDTMDDVKQAQPSIHLASAL